MSYILRYNTFLFVLNISSCFEAPKPEADLKLTGAGGTEDEYVTTVDGWNPANQLRLVASPIISRVFTSQVVVWDFSHQQ